MVMMDKALSFSSLTMHSPPPTVALALREQVLPVGQVPVGANDIPVDMIVTPDETIAGTSDSSK